MPSEDFETNPYLINNENKKVEKMEEIMRKYHLENFTNNLLSILN